MTLAIPLIRNMFLAAITALLAALALGAAPALADPADITAASRGVVRVVIAQTDGTNATLLAHGTGFAVTPELIVTNAHVVDPLRSDNTLLAGVVPPEGRGAVSAKVVAYSARNDLALLRIDPRANLAPLTLYPGLPQDGAQVFAVGYPGNVDNAQGLSMADLVSAQAPVKAPGYVSGGRSSKQFDTILHTAPIGAGNSGGPLLDSCGRVLGVNSFGTVSDNGTDSAFYFAISMREVAAFLKQAGVTAHTSGLPCTSIADLDRADTERAASDQARQAAEQQAKATAHQRALDKARRDAEVDVLTQRDNGMAIAALLLVATLGAGGAAMIFAQRAQSNRQRLAFVVALLALLGAIFAWVLRPPLQSIDSRAEDMVAAPEASAAASPSQAAVTAGAPAGRMICVLDPQRSRVTVSDITDVPLEWTGDGCVNQRSQYGLAQDGWSRILVPNGEDAIAVTHFDPQTKVYTVERYLMSLQDMIRARAERQKIVAPACGAGEDEARRFGTAQQAIRALLPAEPNERMRYNCQPAP